MFSSHSQIICTIFGVHIYFYGVILALAIVAGTLFSEYAGGKFFGLKKETIIDLAPYVIIFGIIVTVTFLFFAFLAVAGFFFADKIMGLIISAGSPELISLATTHFKIMSPIILIGGIIGIFYGLLVTHRQYILPNLSPMVLSLVVITGICLARNDNSGYVLATATLVGACCQLLMQFPKLRQIG